MFISALGVKMRLFKITWYSGVEYIVAPTEKHVTDEYGAMRPVKEVKLEGELVPLPTLEQLVKMGIAERWDD